MDGVDMVVLYSSGEEIAPGDVRADIEAIQRAVRDGLRVTLSAGVSDLCTEPGMLPLAESLPEYRAVDQLCLSLLFHVSLWGLRYGIQMEEVLRALGAHYTDVYQSETLAAKRGLCAGLPVRVPAGPGRPPPPQPPATPSKAWPCGCGNMWTPNTAPTTTPCSRGYSRLVRQERIARIYMPARREVLDFRDPNQVTTLLVQAV